MSLPKSASRNILAGTRAAISLALLPRPLLDDIFLPPTKKNSYGTSNGGSYLKTSFEIWLPTSLLPPLVEWSLPAPSTSTPSTFHLAGHSTLKGNFALPPKGESLPSCPHPSAHLTIAGSQRYDTSLPFHANTLVVPTFPQFSQMTESGYQSSGFCE